MLSYRPLNRRRYSTGKTLLIKLDPLLIGKITKIQSEIFRMILISVLWCMLLVKLSSWRAIRFLYVSVLKNLINMKLRLESKTRYSRNFITFHLCWMTNAVINFFEIQTFERDPSSRMLLCTICYRLSLRCLLFSWTYRNGLYCLGNFFNPGPFFLHPRGLFSNKSYECQKLKFLLSRC